MNKPFVFILIFFVVILAMWIMFIGMSAKTEKKMMEKERQAEMREGVRCVQ